VDHSSEGARDRAEVEGGERLYGSRGRQSIETREKFGDIQLHVEWAAPAEIKGSSQTRGNSGVMLMGRYEIQVLDSYENPTYADGQAGSIYGQAPPPVNVSRKAGEWQTFDIVFEAPHARVGTYAPHGPEDPLLLQNHGSKVRFRNIWIRRL
jgi:Domain of Unknown Function (DUF1080)